MRVELRIEARQDLIQGAQFYEQQREGLGDYFINGLFEDLERLEREAAFMRPFLACTANYRSGFRSPSIIGSINPSLT